MDDKRGLPLRLALSAAFLFMGFSFTVTQALLVRELLVSFAGNELSIGVVFGCWLLLEATGSGWLGRLSLRAGHGPRHYARLQMLFALLLPVVLCGAFGLRHLMGVLPGQGVGLPAIAMASLLLLIPLGLVDGMMFTAGCQVDAGLRRGGLGSVGRVYVYEALGGIAGGLAFTYLFLPALPSLHIALTVGAMNLVSAFSLFLLPDPTSLQRPERSRAAPCLLLVLYLGLLLTPVAGAIHRHLAAWQWRSYDLAFYGHSVYGNVAGIRQRGQVTLFANGLPVLTAPVPDVALVEEMVHLPLLFVPQPRRALVLSGGLGGVLHELLKYPLERVDYAELDPLLIEAARELPTPLTAAELGDPRVRIEGVDGRLLVRRLALGAEGYERGAGSYDLIVVNLPYATTLQLNRFCTVEFWQLVRTLLADGGLVVFPAPGSLTHLRPGLLDLHNALQATLLEVFPHVRPIPGDVTLWLASVSEALERAESEELLARWHERGLSAHLITDFHIRLKLGERPLAWFEGALQEGRPVAVNRDLYPSGLLYGLAHWAEVFSPELVPYFDLLRGLTLPALAVPALGLALAYAAVARRRRPGHLAPIPIAIAATGFGGMTAALLITFAFQVYYGYVYRFIGLLMTAFMAGLSLGAWIMARSEPSPASRGGGQERRRLLWLEGLLLAFWLALPLVLTLLYRRAAWAPVGAVLLALNVLAGLLVGAQFPVANSIYLHRGAGVSRTAGTLYAADLAGAFAAALLVSVALLPALGMVQTCLLVAALKAGSLLLVAATPP